MNPGDSQVKRYRKKGREFPPDPPKALPFFSRRGFTAPAAARQGKMRQIWRDRASSHASGLFACVGSSTQPISLLGLPPGFKPLAHGLRGTSQEAVGGFGRSFWCHGDSYAVGTIHVDVALFRRNR